MVLWREETTSLGTAPSGSGLNLAHFQSDTLQPKLLDLPVPESLWCANPHCGTAAHCQNSDELVLDILDNIVRSAHSSLPQQGGRWVGGRDGKQGRSVPRWVEDVEPHRKLSLYWGDVWRREGRPSAGWLYDRYSRLDTEPSIISL